jgi:hypothetical protein
MRPYPSEQEMLARPAQVGAATASRRSAQPSWREGLAVAAVTDHTVHRARPGVCDQPAPLRRQCNVMLWVIFPGIQRTPHATERQADQSIANCSGKLVGLWHGSENFAPRRFRQLLGVLQTRPVRGRGPTRMQEELPKGAPGRCSDCVRFSEVLETRLAEQSCCRPRPECMEERCDGHHEISKRNGRSKSVRFCASFR